MTPPPPSKIGSAASDLADELEDLQFFPARSSPPTDILIKQHRAASQSSLQSRAASMSQSTSSSSLNSSNSSIGSVFSDDFTLGSRVAGGSTHNSPNLTKKQQVQSQESHSHSHSHAHAQRRTSHPSNNYNRPTSSKERYVFSNFRFLVKEGSVVPKSADEPFDWLSIEMVLVPEIENVLCPICLDVPCTARFTRCGHIYCLPCLLQFFQTSEAAPDGLGNNWRTCPVCAEPLHLKQLRPIKFCPATEPQEGDIFHSILIKKPVGSLHPQQPTFPNDSLTSLSPFQRLIPISRTFVLNQIMTPELVYLRSELKKRKSFGEESLELSFHEAAIKFIEDQRKVLLDLDQNNKSNNNSTNRANVVDFYYYHQSRDGLNVFLHPLCMKILKHHFNTYDSIPSELSLPIIQLERVLVNASNRKRFKYLDHLSLGTQIILVEVDLRSIVSASTLQSHQKELSLRKDARDQKLAYDLVNNPPGRSDRSILEEWKRMEDDFYLTSQAASAMDIRVPESVKLDNLNDDASFPLPSSYNPTGSIPVPPTIKKKIMSPGSPSFSALAHSLNSPFTFNSNFGNESTTASATWTNSWGSSPPIININNNQSEQAVNESPPNKTSTSTSTGTSKKKIVLFSSGLNVNMKGKD